MTTQPHDPYVAPRAAPYVVDGPAMAPYAKVAGYAFLVSIVASAAIGAASAFRYGLTFYGSWAFVLSFEFRVIALEAVRVTAPACALGMTCLAAVTVVHRASRDPAGPRAIDGRRHWLVGGTIACLYPINVVCTLVGAFAVMHWVYDQPTAELVAGFKQTIGWSDAACGAAETAVGVVLASLLLARLLRVVAASRRGLVVKLVVTWLTMQALLFVIQAAATFTTS